jgi:hypothetical protein
MSGGSGGPIILRAIIQTLGSTYTSSAPVRVWHSLVASAVLGFVLGKIF